MVSLPTEEKKGELILDQMAEIKMVSGPVSVALKKQVHSSAVFFHLMAWSVRRRVT